MYQISDTDFVQTLKAYENHKTQLCIYKAVVHIWSFLFLGTNGVFFSKFLATHIAQRETGISNKFTFETFQRTFFLFFKGIFVIFRKLVIVVIVVYSLTIYYYAINFLCLKMIKICTIILSYPEENQTPFLAQ